MSAEVLTIYGRLIGTNELINTARTNRFLAAKQKHEQMDIVTAAILSDKEFRNNKYTKSVVANIDFYEPNEKKDVDNVIGGGIKIIFDSLVVNGILADDSRKYLSKVVCSVYVDKASPRIEVRLIEE